MRIALPVVTSLLFAGVAHAQVVVATEGNRYAEPPPDAEPPAPRRVEGRVGAMLGGSAVGDADGFSVGVAAGLGYRIGDLTLRGTFDYYRVGDNPDEAPMRSGRAARFGGAVRYSFANTGGDESRGLDADFWGEVGLGYERVAWKQGGVLDRPSGELAIGFDLDGHGDAHNHRQHHFGMFMDFRTLLARGPEMDVPAACGGPCSEATKPSQVDVSMFFDFGVHWGRQ